MFSTIAILVFILNLSPSGFIFFCCGLYLKEQYFLRVYRVPFLFHFHSIHLLRGPILWILQYTIFLLKRLVDKYVSIIATTHTHKDSIIQMLTYILLWSSMFYLCKIILLISVSIDVTVVNHYILSTQNIVIFIT